MTISKSTRRRSIIAAALVCCCAAAVAVAGGISVTPSVQTKVSRQAVKSFRGEFSTNDNGFKRLAGLNNIELCNARSGVSVTITVEISGGPSEIRVTYRRGAREFMLAPGPLRFAGSESHDTISATFVDGFPRNVPDNYDVEWRSVNGETITAHRGAARVLFAGGRPGTCD